ncbi:hypothetical protein [Enterobacter roggenkampii]|uniref:hypothetical protein n=1 Tax=Enterobacter cloacae complex TaxID=354276 RepID=UPI000696F7E4|nr:hypothetical protein [Enterobacter roggenkampii]
MSTITKEFTKEQLTGIIESVDDLNEELENDRKCHGMAGNKITEKWDYLNDRVAPPEVVKRLAEVALASLEAEPVAYMVGTQLLENMTQAIAYKADTAMQIKPLFTAPPAPVTINAEPVAWLWSHRKHPSEVTLVRPEDDERAEGAHWSGWSCQALYAAPPAPAAMKDHQIRELVNELRDIAVEYHGTQQLRERIARTIRAAMLHGADGNSPVIPDGWVMVPEEPTHEMLEAGDEQFGTYDVYRRMIAAALQQEVKP